MVCDLPIEEKSSNLTLTDTVRATQPLALMALERIAE